MEWTYSKKDTHGKKQIIIKASRGQTDMGLYIKKIFKKNMIECDFYTTFEMCKKS